MERYKQTDQEREILPARRHARAIYLINARLALEVCGVICKLFYCSFRFVGFLGGCGEHMHLCNR